MLRREQHWLVRRAGVPASLVPAVRGKVQGKPLRAVPSAVPIEAER